MLPWQPAGSQRSLAVSQVLTPLTQVRCLQVRKCFPPQTGTATAEYYVTLSGSSNDTPGRRAGAILCRLHTLLLLDKMITITQLAYCKQADRLHGLSQPGVLTELSHHSLGKGVQASMHKLCGLLQLALLGKETAALNKRLKLLLSPEDAHQHYLVCREQCHEW